MNRINLLLGNNLLVTVLCLLLIIEFVSLSLEPTFRDSGEIQTAGDTERLWNGGVLRISEIDGPRIDSMAAMIVAPDEKPALPASTFLFVLIAYVMLLIYNFSATFRRVTKPQWFWETLYTVSALLGWYLIDGTVHYWFPLLVVKTGLLIFALYLVLFSEKLSKEALKRSALSPNEQKENPA